MKRKSDVQIAITQLHDVPIANYKEWVEITMRLLTLVDWQQSRYCTRMNINIAKYNSANYFAIARLIAQFMDNKASVTRIQRGEFELITYTANIADFTAVMLFLLEAVNALTISYCSAQVTIWREECRALNIAFKDRKAFGKYGRTEAVRDSFFAQALEELFFKFADYFKK